MAAALCLTAVQCHMQFPLVADLTTAQQQSTQAQSVGFGDKLPVTKYLLCDLRVLSYNMGTTTAAFQGVSGALDRSGGRQSQGRLSRKEEWPKMSLTD